MRFMMMHKVDAKMEAGVLPSQELIAGMGKLMGSVIQSGALVDGDGLLPSRARVRLRFSRGDRTVTKGPYTGENELPARVAKIKVSSFEEAIDWATRFANVFGDGEIEVGPLTEAWDLGMMPKPENAPMRFLLLHKADKDYEAGIAPSAKVTNDFAKLTDEMTKAGVLLASISLRPSSKASRIKYSGGKRSLIDGPFAESKEMIAGFVMLDLKSIDELLEFANRFAEIIGDTEIDVRQVDA